MTPAPVWTNPEATMLSQRSRTRKDKRGRVCEAPGALRPRDTRWKRGRRRCQHCLGTELRRQAGRSGVRAM